MPCRLVILTWTVETLKTTTPLVNKVILSWLTESYVFSRTTEAERTALGISNVAPRGVGFGIGLAFAIFAMQEVASLVRNAHTKPSTPF